jgi:hypothetical protein
MRTLLASFALIPLVAAATGLAAAEAATAPPPDLSGVDLRPMFEVSRIRSRQYVGPVLPPPNSRNDDTITVTRGGAVLATLFTFTPEGAPSFDTTSFILRGHATAEQLRRLRGLARQWNLESQPDCVLRNDPLAYEWAFRGTTTYVWFGRQDRSSFTILHRDRGSGPVAQRTCPRTFFDLEREVESWLWSVAANPNTEVLRAY